jgi:hypothetical protein
LNCPVLKSKSNGGKGLSGGTSRPHALAVPVGGGQGALGLDAENMCPEKPAMVASVVPSLPVVVEVPGVSEGSSLLWADMVPPDYSEFIREGFVSLVGRSQKVPVKILRDTGGSASFILDSVLDFSEESSLGRSVLIQDMGMHTWPAPLHRIELDHELVKGEVAIALKSKMPVEGVSVVLGNDLAKGWVWGGVPPPVVTSGPTISTVPDSSEKEFPEVFTACVVTRSMSGTGPEKGIKESGRFKNAVSQLPDLPLALSKSELIIAQQEDPELKGLFSEVKPTDEMESLACGYFLLDDTLVRKWLPHDDCSVDDPVLQVVVPAKFREVILETVHGEVAGHMGVRKNCNRLLRYFFWSRLKKEVTRFIKTCLPARSQASLTRLSNLHLFTPFQQ